MENEFSVKNCCLLCGHLEMNFERSFDGIIRCEMSCGCKKAEKYFNSELSICACFRINGKNKFIYKKRSN